MNAIYDRITYCEEDEDVDSIFDYLEKHSTFEMNYSNDFIKDSLFCEHGYIINLDTNMLEYWRGFQTEKDDNNRYGTVCDRGYYPCKLKKEISLENIQSLSDDDFINMLPGDDE